MSETEVTPVYTYDVQYFVEFLENGAYTDPVQVTEDKTFDTSRDISSYEASYLCKKRPTKYEGYSVDKWSFVIDGVGPGELQKMLAKYEDKTGVPVRLTRVLAYDFAAGKRCASGSNVGKRCTAKLDMNPMSGAFGELVNFSGDISQEGDWEYGTADASTGAWTAASSV